MLPPPLVDALVNWVFVQFHVEALGQGRLLTVLYGVPEPLRLAYILQLQWQVLLFACQFRAQKVLAVRKNSTLLVEESFREHIGLIALMDALTSILSRLVVAKVDVWWLVQQAFVYALAHQGLGRVHLRTPVTTSSTINLV